jgi:hypothetical protein
MAGFFYVCIETTGAYQFMGSAGLLLFFGLIVLRRYKQCLVPCSLRQSEPARMLRV